MQKLQDSVFSIVKSTNLSPAVFNFLQPSDDFGDKTPLGGILKDTKYGWLALGPKFCVVDLRTGLKVAARTFGASLSNNTSVTCVVELPTPLTENSQQLVISLQCEDIGIICVLHINGSQILRCLQTDVVVTELAICDRIPDGPFTSFDGLVMAGTKRGEIFVFDLNRASLIQALKDISQGYEHLVQNEANPTTLSFLPLNNIRRIEEQRELALENDHHLALLLNENSMVDGQYIFRNPDGTVRMKAKRDHIRVTVLQYIPQLGSVAVGFNFGAFQIWNLMTLDLEFTSQVNVECLPVTHFAFQEPCDDPRAFCYLWVVFSVIDRFEEEEFPLAVMYSLTYQGKRMLSDTKCLYQDFSTATIRFQIELGTLEESPLLGGKCISCHSYSIKSTLGDEGEDSMLNICQLVWECWGEDTNAPMQYGMLLFDLDQWYKDQMPATYRLESNAFMSATWCTELTARGAVTLHARLEPASVCPYSHATRLEEHFYPNSLQYNCTWLSTSEALSLRTVGVQRQVIAALDAGGGVALLHPARLHAAAARAGLAPHAARSTPRSEEDQRRYLLSIALEARLSRFLKRCAHDWATGTHSGVGCTLPFLVDWAWKRAVELKENAKELTAPLFVSSALPDRNVVRCLEHCVQQLTQLTGLMDAILTKCCNLVVPDALSEMEERHVGIGCVALYFQVVQWFLRVGLLPERGPARAALPYPRRALADSYDKRRLKLNRLQDNSSSEENDASKSCSLLYIDQLIEHEFGGKKIHQMWINGGSECQGLYPPPSLYSLLRLYLLPEIAEEHKHSLVLYLLVDYSMVYDDVRYEAVIRRLMQFPTMFGLSNTAIKATQAFWHLDHRDFDFALDQLQCLTGNTLHEWQHNVVLSSLLAQKKTQAALQYLHVRKPAPIQNIKDCDLTPNYSHRLNDHDKLEDWQSCCNLYLARGLVYEALDVIRMCVQNAASLDEKVQVLTFFFKGCRNTGNLSKVLQVTLQPYEEEVFVKYLENCNEPQTSDLLIMYYLQQARYLEAERYNNKLKQSKPQRNKELSTSVESLFEFGDSAGARDALVEVACAALPSIAGTVAHCALRWSELAPQVTAARPMSVFVQANSPKNTFTYKSTFIQDTIESASETWMNRPKMRKGLKRALNIEETPFICTPKLLRTRSVFSEELQSESSPAKRARLNVSGARTPRGASFRVSDKLSGQMDELLDMPEAQSPLHAYPERAETPHSILKSRRLERDDAPSPVDSRGAADSDDELLETASSHTHYSDSTNKHLRFTMPTASESGSTPSPPLPAAGSHRDVQDRNRERSREKALALSHSISAFMMEKDADVSVDSFVTTTSHPINESHPFESPPKKLATESNVKPRRSYKDTVRARRSFSISANSSLSEDPNTSIESIADIPVTLINPRYSGEKKKNTPFQDEQNSEHSNFTQDMAEDTNNAERQLEQTNFTVQGQERNLGQSNFSAQEMERKLDQSNYSAQEFERDSQSHFSVKDLEYKYSIPLHITLQEDAFAEAGEGSESVERTVQPRTPRGRRGIRSIGGESTPLINRSRSGTPERQDSPVVTPLRTSRITRSRSKTPELSPRSSPLPPIPEQPRLEVESEPHAARQNLVVPRQTRSRSRTPERIDKGVSESPKLAVIKESPTKLSNTDSSSPSPTRRSLRSRSRTPEMEIVPEPTVTSSTRSLRSRSKTPEKLMSPKRDHSVRTKKSLSRIVLEANTFAKTKQTLETLETEITESKSESVIECTPMKTFKQVPSLMDVTLSPISNKSVLQSSSDTTMSETIGKDAKNENALQISLVPLPAFTTLQETYFEKSVLQSYESSVGESSQSIQEVKHTQAADKTADLEKVLKPLPSFTTMYETDYNKSVLHSYESSVAETSQSMQESIVKETVVVEQNIPKPFAAFSSMIQTDFDRSVLHSHQSSVAELSDASKDIQNENASSLITNDSDIEMKEDAESQDTAERKEKEKIVEIEREIIDIEGNMSNDSERGDSDHTVESIENEEEESEEESEESESEESGTEESSSSSSEDEEDNDQDEVISVKDSDSELSNSNKDSDSNQQANISDIEEIDDKNVVSEDIEGSSIDPLNQAQVSLMTDDNSAAESDQSINLNYSDEKIEPTSYGNKDEQPKKQDVIKEVHIQVIVEEVSPEACEAEHEASTEAPKSLPQSMDVVDTSAPEPELKEAQQPEITKSLENKNVLKTSQTTKSTEPSQSKDETKETVLSKPARIIRKRVTCKSSIEIENEPLLKATSSKTIKKTDSTPKESAVSKELDDKNETGDLKTPVTRKRANSDASATAKASDGSKTGATKELGHKDTEKTPKTGGTEVMDSKETDNTQEPVELKTPVTPKRVISDASATAKASDGPKTEATKELGHKDTEKTPITGGTEIMDSKETDNTQEPVELKTPVTRKRVNSNASATAKASDGLKTGATKELGQKDTEKTPKPTEEPKTGVTEVMDSKETDNTLEPDELKTPVTRKRVNSNASATAKASDGSKTGATKEPGQKDTEKTPKPTEGPKTGVTEVMDSKDTDNTQEPDELKTPVTRKRVNSNASATAKASDVSKTGATKELGQKDTEKTSKPTEELRTGVTEVMDSKETDNTQEPEELKTPVTRKRVNSNASAKAKASDGSKTGATKELGQKDTEKTSKPTEELRTGVTEVMNSKETDNTQEPEELKTPVTRKRVNSNASAKAKPNVGSKTGATKELDNKETDKITAVALATEIPKSGVSEVMDTKEPKYVQESNKPKTPVTRKRTQSNASKSEEKTPEDGSARRRAKTPTSAEVRKIITRRVSREMAGKLDESNQSLDESVSLTPKRRSSRTKSKIVDDNESVASGSSVVSNWSKVSEDTDAKPLKKGKKPVLATKPDLSVIPEAIAEENKEDVDHVIAEYSGSRRLTRNQKALLHTWLEPTDSPSTRSRRRASYYDDDAFDVQPIDRISLLNKTDFEGPPDEEEFQHDLSPESLASDASKLRRSRMSRAASESKTVPKAAKIGRRTASVDVGETSDFGSPVLSGTDSPARGRRASFNRACEALHTPKGRRASTDLRKSIESPVISPAVSETDLSVTPARRTRRASTLSNTSQPKSETGKRSKKMPVLEEDKETNK